MLAIAARSRTYPVLLPSSGPGVRSTHRTRRRLRASPPVRALVAAALVVVSAVAYVSQSTAAARTGYAILTLQQDIERLQVENARLVAMVTALRSPDRIARVALGELGMVKPGPQQLTALTLPAPEVAAVPAPAPSLWQRLGALLLGRAAAASETR